MNDYIVQINKIKLILFLSLPFFSYPHEEGLDQILLSSFIVAPFSTPFLNIFFFPSFLLLARLPAKFNEKSEGTMKLIPLQVIE